MKDSKMIAIISILMVCYLVVVISIDKSKTISLSTRLSEINDFKTILDEKGSIYIEKIYSDETKGYEYYEKIGNRVLYESKNENQFINIEDGVIYTKNNNELKIDVSFNNNIYELPLLINKINYKDDILEKGYNYTIDETILKTVVYNENGGVLRRTFYFDNEDYYLTKIIEEEFDDKNLFLRSTISVINYGKKITRSRDAIISAAGENSIDLYLIKNKDTNTEVSRYVKASTNCKYITATNWNDENYNFKLSFDYDENKYSEILSLENEINKQVLIYVEG